MNIKNSLTNNERLSVLKSCVYGEELAIEAYNNALSRDLHHLSDALISIVENQREILKQDEKTVK